MSVGTIVKTPHDGVYVNGIAIRSYDELQNRIDEELEYINECKTKLLQLASCTPKDLFPSNGEDNDTIWQLNEEFDNIWSSLQESYNMINKLYQIESLIDEWKYNGDNSINIETKEGWDSVVIID